jgi:hypothetical protein
MSQDEEVEDTKMEMRKVLVSVFAVLVLFSVSYGVTGFTVSGSTDAGTVNQGDTLSVAVISDAVSGGLSIFGVYDTGGAAGTVSSVVLNAGYDWADFTNLGAINTGSALIATTTGKTGIMSPKISVGAHLLSFDYLVPNQLGAWSIFGGTSQSTGAASNADGTALAPLTMNIVPEPMTVVLLGLGGLFLRRRK